MHFFFEGLLYGLLALVVALFLFWIVEVTCKCAAIYKKFQDIQKPLDCNIMRKVDAGTLQCKLTESKDEMGVNNAGN